MSRLKEIFEYLISVGEDEEELKKTIKNNPLVLSVYIARYAHKNQKRENGEPYVNHPKRCVRDYRDLSGFFKHDNYWFDEELLYACHIPYLGVQEVCMLHDVIEDTDFTFEDLEEIFAECDLIKYYREIIEEPLRRITHDKSMDYLDYIIICMGDPVSALAKMLDLKDNLNVLSLLNFSDKNYQRTKKYLSYIYLINAKYHFLERFNEYRKAFEKIDFNKLDEEDENKGKEENEKEA